MQNSKTLCSKNKPGEFESLLDQLKFIFAKIRYQKGPHCPSCHPEMKIIAQQTIVQTTFQVQLGLSILLVLSLCCDLTQYSASFIVVVYFGMTIPTGNNEWSLLTSCLSKVENMLSRREP